MDMPVVSTARGGGESVKQFRRFTSDYKRFSSLEQLSKIKKKDYGSELERINAYKLKSRDFEDTLAHLHKESNRIRGNRLELHRAIWGNAWEFYEQQQDGLETEVMKLLCSVISNETEATVVSELMALKDSFDSLQDVLEQQKLSFAFTLSLNPKSTQLPDEPCDDDLALCAMELSGRKSSSMRQESNRALKEGYQQSLRLLDCDDEEEPLRCELLEHLDLVEQHCQQLREDLVSKFKGSRALDIDGDLVQVPKGWSEALSFNLRKLEAEYQRAAQLKLLPPVSVMSALVERARLEMPQFTKHQILGQIHWLKVFSSFEKQLKAVHHSEQQQYHDSFRLAKKQLVEAKQQRLQLEANIKKLEHQYQNAVDIAERLRRLRQLKQEQLDEEESIARAERERAAEALEKQKIETQERRRRIHEKLAQHRQSELEREQAILLQQKEVEAFYEKLKSERQAACVARVKFREETRQKKLERAQKLQQEREEQRATIDKQLERLCETVRPVVSSSWERATKEILSTKLRNESKKEVTGQELFSVKHGYSKEQILKDRRSRLNLAFASLNLQHSSYAREILIKESLQVPQPPHLKSSIGKFVS